MSQEQPKENMMGYLPIGRLLMKVSLPMILSMLVQALYNVVDSIFVSRISPDAFSALNLMFPIQTLMIAVASGTGTDFAGGAGFVQMQIDVVVFNGAAEGDLHIGVRARGGSGTGGGSG